MICMIMCVHTQTTQYTTQCTAPFIDLVATLSGCCRRSTFNVLGSLLEEVSKYCQATTPFILVANQLNQVREVCCSHVCLCMQGTSSVWARLHLRECGVSNL